jgi:hypothetical protein
MQVKDLIKILMDMDPEHEVVLHHPGSFNSPGYSSTRLRVTPGFLVRDPEDSGSWYTKKNGVGLFVDQNAANRVMPDGQKFLDTSSPTIHPAISLDLPKY